MAIHMGSNIRRIIEQQGMSVKSVAESLSMHRNTLHRILQQDSIDTGVLMKLCKLMHHDFFRELSDEVQGTSVSEPTAAYGNRPRSVTRVIIELDEAASEGTKDAALSIVERLRSGQS